MLSDIPGNVLPEQSPGPFATNDVATFDELDSVAKSVLAKCTEKRWPPALGWLQAGKWLHLTSFEFFLGKLKIWAYCRIA